MGVRKLQMPPVARRSGAVLHKPGGSRHSFLECAFGKLFNYAAPERRATGRCARLSVGKRRGSDTIPAISPRLDQFHFYSKAAATRRTRRDLPHWDQPCVCTFVTFRMVDSLPQEIIAGWVAERDAWLFEHGLDPTEEHWRAALRALPDETVNEFHRTFTRPDARVP